MATKFKKGDVVVLDMAVPSGPVLSLHMDSDGVVHYLIEWVDNDGQSQQRWFAEDELRAAG
jgi:uncharacterized protein YodC (DUF2158 family)